MKRLFAGIIFFACTAFMVNAQGTVVSGTVTDTAAQTWNNGTFTFQLVANPRFPNLAQYAWTGGKLNQTIEGSLNGLGAYSQSIPSNSAISPQGSTWQLKVCPLATASCSLTADITITGTTQILNATPPAIAINLLKPDQFITAYADSEIITAFIGGQYYNLTTQLMRDCTTVVGQACTVWVDIGAGGALLFIGVPTGPCLASQTAVDTVTGNFYNCLAGVWHLVGPGTGTLTSPVTSPNPLAFDVSLGGFKGPSPWTDVTRYGVRSMVPSQPPAAVGITATISSGSAVATVSTSVCSAQVGSVCFKNGDGVVVYGAGAAQTLTTPSAPTIVPSVAIAGTGTGFVTPSATGAGAYCARVIAQTKNGGYTAAGPETCIATSQTLGVPTPVSISSIVRANDIVTVTLSAPHNFLVGCGVTTCGEVYVTGVTDVGAVQNIRDFDGWWAVESATDNTHFTFSSAHDTRNGAVSSGTGGTAQWFNCNRVSWPQVTGAWRYYIYTGATGAETLRGVSRPQGSVFTDLTWDDFGSPMMDNFQFSPFIPTNFPVAATSDHLVTTISSGAGTTTLTLANTASTSVAGATIRFDNAPNIIAAATVIANTSAAGIQGGCLYIPMDTSSGNNFYVNNSYINLAALPQTVPICQSGQLFINETWELKIGAKWYGDRPTVTKGTGGGFSAQSNPPITVGATTPGIYIGNNNLSATVISGLSIGTSSSVQNGALLIFAEGQFNYSFDNLNLVTGTTTTDYMGIALYLRGATGQSAAFGQFTKLYAAAGSSSPSQDGFTHTPVIFCRGCGATYMHSIFMAHRNMMFVGVSEGGSDLTIDTAYTQGSVMPFLTTTQIFNGMARMCNVTLDSTLHPMYTVLPSAGQVSVGGLDICDLPPAVVRGNGASPNILSGLRVPTRGLVDITGEGVNINPSRSASAIISGPTRDGIFGSDNTYMINANAAAVATNPSYPIFVANATPPAPTCVVSAGGSVTLGTYAFQVAPVWWNNSDGLDSFLSTPCTTTSGQQTITVNWSAIPGNPKSITVLANNTSSSTGLAGTSTSVVYSSGTPGNGGTVWSNIPSGGPTMMMPGVQGMVSPLFFPAPSLVASLPAAAAGNAGQMRGVIDSTAIAAEGQTCVGGGTVAALAFSNGTVWKCF